MRPLAMCGEGERVVVKGIAGGRGVRGRLEGLGVVPGAVVEVLKSGPGPLVIKVDNSRIALGFGEAMKVYVEEMR